MSIKLETDYNNSNSTKEYSNNKNKKILKSVSYRLPVEIIDKLDERSKDLQLSPSFLVKQTLTKYVKWDIYASELDLIPFPKEMLNLLIKYVPFDKINELGQSMYEFIKDWIIYQKRKYTWEGFLEIFSNLMEASGIKFILNIEPKNTNVIIRHKMGTRWSIFFEIVFVGFLKDFMDKDLGKTIITKNTCKIIFPTMT